MRNTTPWRPAVFFVAVVLIPAFVYSQTSRRPITLDDHSRLVGVGDPQRSPEGDWVAYTVTTVNAETDKRNTDLWMVKWDGSRAVAAHVVA